MDEQAGSVRSSGDVCDLAVLARKSRTRSVNLFVGKALGREPLLLIFSIKEFLVPAEQQVQPCTRAPLLASAAQRLFQLESRKVAV